jgi:peptidyl-dipeptidase Dcp
MENIARPVGNPLIDLPDTPYGAPAFDVIKAEHILPALDYALAEGRKDIAGIRDNPAPPDFKNTIEALEFAGALIGPVGSAYGHLHAVMKSAALDAIEQEITDKSVRYGNDLLLDEKLFLRVKTVYDMRATLQLDATQRMLLEETYKGFSRNGALLDEAAKAELRDIDEKLANTANAFQKNTTDATAAFTKTVVREEELAGIPQRTKDAYRERAVAAGLTNAWLIPLSPPPVTLLEYAENRALREEIWRANANRAYKDSFDNTGNVLDIVKLRHQRAQLLGYKSHAAFVLEDRMAHTPETVQDFLDGNEKIYLPAAKKHLEALRDFARGDGLNEELQPWDFGYYSRKLQEKTFSVDLEEVRAYFDLGRTLQGMFTHAEKLFDVKFEEIAGKYPVYHPDVQVFEMRDNRSGKVEGLLYCDFYARAGQKRNGAWMNGMRPRGAGGDINTFPIVGNTCNFEKPAEGQPSLLSLDDVRTLFHEFGHALHGLLAKGPYPSLNGTNVKWDFVELPSQLQENWVKEKEVLDTFAVHATTGEKMPQDLIQKISDMDNFGVGYGGQRQTCLAKIDMKWHTTDPATITSVESLEDSVIATSSLFPRLAGPLTTTFGHLFADSTGYSSGYYSYKWAEVLEADVYEAFQKNGLYDRKTADRLRDTIYSSGGTVDPAQLFRDMMGRDPDQSALFRREGLT